GIPDAATGREREMYAAADAYLADLFRWHPTAATASGYHRHDAALDDWSPAAVRERAAVAHRHRAALEPFTAAALSPGARIDLRLVLDDIEGTLFGLEDLRPHERDPQFHVDLLGNSLLYLTLLEPGAPEWPA